MARVYIRLLVARMRARRGQLALSLAVMATASTLLVVALVVRHSAAAPFDRVLEQAHGPHLVLQGASPEALDRAAARVAHLIAARAVNARVLGGGALSTSGRSYPLQFWALAEPAGTDRAPEVGGAGIIVDGRWLAGAGEAVIDSGLAGAAGIRVGDQIVVAGPGATAALTVVGTAVITVRAPYPLWDPALVFVDGQSLDALAGGAASRFALGLRLRNAAATDFAAMQIFAGGGAGPGGDMSVLRSTTIREVVAEELTGHIMVLQTFGGFALVAALLILGNLAAARLVAETREIGVLKAMGLTPREVGLLYVLELTALAAVAAGLGIAIAYVVAPIMVAPTANLLHTAPVVALPGGGVLIVFATVVLLAAASSLVPAVIAARLATVPALTDVGRRPVRPSRIARAAAVLRVPLDVRTGLGDAFSRPIRAWLTVLAIGTLGASAVATLTFEATVSGFVTHPARVGIPPFDTWWCPPPAATGRPPWRA